MKTSQNKDHRYSIAQALTQYARRNKISIERAYKRAQGSPHFDTAIEQYMKAKKIGRCEAWRRVYSALPEAK